MIRPFNAIKVLSLAVSFPETRIHPTSHLKLSFPQLYTLGICVRDRSAHQFRLVWLSKLHLPALRRLSLPYGLVEAQPEDDRYLHKGVRPHIAHIDYPAFTLQSKGLPFILPHCPSLREVTLPADVFTAILFTLPNLCGVKLHFYDRRDLEGLDVRLRSLWEGSPQLKLIRFLNFNWKEFPYYHRLAWNMFWEEEDLQLWTNLIRESARNGVRIECKTGELLEPPLLQLHPQRSVSYLNKCRLNADISDECLFWFGTGD
jgi:hypothetical protein